MSKFNDYLIESKLSISDAELILGLDGSYSSKDETAAYRKLAKENHPDRGGDVEMMKRINLAHSKLKGKSKDEDVKKSWDDIHKEYNELASFIANDLVSKYSPDKFIKYFEDQFNLKFTHVMEIKGGGDVGTGLNLSSPSFAGFKSKYSTADNKIVFDFDVLVYLPNIDNNNNTLSGNPDISYTISVTAFGYSNRKKQKMSQRDWKHIQNHSLLNDPKKSFSLAKMKKMNENVGNPKMKRADFLLGLKNEVKISSWNTDSYTFEIKGGAAILISRMVWMRMPVWTINKVGTKTKYKFTESTRLITSFGETSDTLDMFIKLKSMNEKQAIKYIQDEHKNKNK